MEKFSENVIKIIKAIPYGKVMTYGQIALLAGNPYGARQVSRLLHSLTNKENLPWFRVVNKNGMISLQNESGLVQKALLVDEGIEFINDKIDLNKYGVKRKDK
jgi:methylated-DNA-protein-cysteine methyltransferase-like protein